MYRRLASDTVGGLRHWHSLARLQEFFEWSCSCSCGFSGRLQYPSWRSKTPFHHRTQETHRLTTRKSTFAFALTFPTLLDILQLYTKDLSLTLTLTLTLSLSIDMTLYADTLIPWYVSPCARLFQSIKISSCVTASFPDNSWPENEVIHTYTHCMCFH